MNDTAQIVPETAPPSAARAVPQFSKYAVEPDGTCWRVVPPTRGRFAGSVRPVKPSIHPRGHQWCVMLTGDDGVRVRMPVKRLVKLVFG
jgi:hypothetical protein